MDTVKDKTGKPALASLMLPGAMVAITRVREYGLRKYPDANNWRNVPTADWLDAAMRHLVRFASGEEWDEESGLPHLHHALCDIAYMVERAHYHDEWLHGELDENRVD